MALPVLSPGAPDSAAVVYLKNLVKLDLSIHGQSELAGNITEGPYGPATVAGVKYIQKAHGLVVDAIVGPVTWKVLENNIKNAIWSRGSWGAKPPKDPLQEVNWTTNTTTYIHHSVTNEPRGNVFALATLNAEKAHMRLLQNIAFERGFLDISYSYIIMPSGRIFEGRGKELLGAHTLGHNKELGVCFAGNYEIDDFTDAQEVALEYLREHLDITGSIKPHCSVYSTSCPGKNVRAALGLTCGSRSAELPEHSEPQDHEEGDIQ